MPCEYLEQHFYTTQIEYILGVFVLLGGIHQGNFGKQKDMANIRQAMLYLVRTSSGFNH
jgi:hypothetical protein